MTFLAWVTDRESTIGRVPELKKLDSFRSLPVGWHYGSGGPISAAVIDNAAAVYKFFRLVGFTRTNFFAGVNGEILATAYRQHHYVGVMIEPSGANTVTYEVGNREVTYLENLDLTAIKGSILAIAGEIWNISALPTLATMTTIAANSTTWYLRTPQVAGYPSSKSHAQKIPA
jgi:hypothetical protein